MYGPKGWPALTAFDTPMRAVKWKQLPRPGSLSTHRHPPIIFTSRSEMVSPRPVPPYRRVVEPSACEKASKIFFCFSAGMPMPVSRTVKCSSSESPSRLSRSARTTISPRSVNLTALPTRLTTTWRNRPASPCSASGTLGANP